MGELIVGRGWGKGLGRPDEKYLQILDLQRLASLNCYASMSSAVPVLASCADSLVTRYTLFRSGVQIPSRCQALCQAQEHGISQILQPIVRIIELGVK